jgi:hypothetical protein
MPAALPTQIMSEVKTDFATDDEYQASYLIAQAANELCPELIWSSGIPPLRTGRRADERSRRHAAAPGHVVRMWNTPRCRAMAGD